MERNIVSGLRKWSCDNHIPQMALKSLLDLLNTNLALELPKDPRTLMGTPRALNIREMGENGQYWHNGFEMCLKRIFSDIGTPLSISININIDGLPIYKSTTKNFWPILCNIYEYPDIQPFVAGLYYGTGKPKDINEFLNPFVDEVLPLLESGITINGHKLTITIRCFICDTPARSFIKGVVNFNAKYGCIKCTTKGRYSHISGTMTYPQLNAPKRTDQKFRMMEYADHQRNTTPLVKLPMDLIRDVIVGDSLHLLELGVMKKLLTSWRTGTMSMKAKWSCAQKREISETLVRIKFPIEIHRQMRSLDYVALWKGLEYRNFLNYVSIVVLKDYLPVKHYDHLLLLFCAVRICSSKKYEHLIPVARSLLIDFIENYKCLYGTDFVTSNIHNLCHIADEVEHFGPLPSFSAYPFENYMHALKKLVQTGPNPLAQVAARITEAVIADSSKTTKFSPLQNQSNAFVQYQRSKMKISFPNFTLTSDFSDKWFLTKQFDIVEVSGALQKDTGLLIEGHKVLFKKDFFPKPFKSSFLQIYISKISPDNISRSRTFFRSQNVYCKLVPIERKEGVVFVPLIHTIQC